MSARDSYGAYLRGNCRSFCLTAVIVATQIVLTACSDSRSTSAPVKPLTTVRETENNSDPKWVVRGEVPAKVAVVFVHGLWGDTFETWTHANGTRFFDLVAADPEIAGNVDILAYGFPSHMFASGSFDIQAAALALHARLKHHGVLGYRKVVFVGHSMGGLVVMRELLMNRAVLPKVPVIVLLATPQEGSDVVRIAKYIARNPALSDLKPADSNKLLQILNDDWRAWPDRPKVQCGYENKKTHGAVMIVEWSSGTRFCDEAVEIPADHISVAKPESAEHLAVIVVTNALKDYALNPALEPKLETPDFVDEGNQSVFTLSALNSRQPALVKNSGGSELLFSTSEPSERNLLLLWPDRPEQLRASSESHVYVYLNSQATGSEHRFKLRADYGFERTVVVRVPNIAAIRGQQVRLMAGTTGAILEQFESGEQTSNWIAAPADDAAVPTAIVRIVRDRVAREYPEWPTEMQWVIAADILNGLNWPGLATQALRQAERLAPQLVKQGGAQQVAAVAATLSGDQHVFAMIDTPVLAAADAKAADNSWLAANSVKVEATKLATKLQQVPALQFYGLSLQGDVKKATGDVEGARAAYQDAAVIRPSPSVTRRLESTGGWRATGDIHRSDSRTESEGSESSSDTRSRTGSTVRSESVVIVQPADLRSERAVTQPTLPDRGATVVQPVPENP